MELTGDSKILKNFLFDNNIIEYKLNKNGIEIFNEIFKIYNDISKYQVIVSQKILTNYKKELSKGTFLPNSIFNYIKNTAGTCIIYNFKIEGKIIELRLVSYDDSLNIDYLNSLYNYIVLILKFFIKISHNKCNEHLKIEIFLTDFKKTILKDNILLGAININTGYSYVCQKNGMITIYRKEECLKVVIHECMHAFGLEFSHLNLDELNRKTKEIFPLKIEMNLFEAYTELWAELLNISLISYKTNPKIKKNYIDNIERMLSYEMKFSEFQIKKILYYNNIRLDELFKYENKYRENTSVFSYYIMKGILLFNINGFFNWCKKNNKGIIKFREDKDNLYSFYQLIKNSVDKLDIEEFKNDIYKLKNINQNKFYFILNTLRMSSLEI
tara:strand:+ start:185 stop:1339 length:1155 start_codon:yes stop_codon:yes gene_type:complete